MNIDYNNNNIFEYYLGSGRKYDNIKRRKSSMKGLAIIIIVTVVIVAIGSLVGIYAATQAVDSVVSSSDVLISPSVAGNDIISFRSGLYDYCDGRIQYSAGSLN